MTRTRPAELNFFSLAFQLALAVAIMASVGLPLCNWHLGRWLLVEVALAAVAAALPLLMTGRITVEIARRYSMPAAGSFYMDYRLALLRGVIALMMLRVGMECLDPHTGAALSWFVGIYVVLAALGARWLARGRRHTENG